MDHVVTAEDVPIQSEADVVTLRRKVRALAEAEHLDPYATAAVTTAASELSRNVCKHGGGGMAHVEIVDDESRRGIRIEFTDEGPGIADLERALSGRHSTVQSLGLGLAGSRRLVDEFDIETEVGHGTRVRIAKWKRH